MPAPSSLQRLLDRIENAALLDPVVKVVRSGVGAVLARQDVKDALHGVWLGHPLHPMLTDVPVGAWTSAALLDAMPGSGTAPDRLIAVGVLAAVPTVVTGLADWSDTHQQQQRVGVVHALANTVALGCYVASLAARRQGRRARGRLLAYAGLTAAAAGGYLGGHLAFRQAVGANHAEFVPHLTPPGWHHVADLDDLPDDSPVERRLGSVALMVLRRGTSVHVIANRCSHLDGPLADGKLTYDGAGELCVQCPWHGSTFRLRDGEVVHGPATAPQPVFQTRVEGGRVEIMLAGAG